MAQLVAERADIQVFDPLFSEVHPVRRDINAVRSITRALEDDRFVRVRKLTPISRVELPSGAMTESASSHLLVDITKPITDSRGRYVRIGSATWGAAGGNTIILEPTRAQLVHIEVDDLPNNYGADDVFKDFDKQRQALGYGRVMPGWFEPDIYTAEGLQELASLLKEGDEA